MTRVFKDTRRLLETVRHLHPEQVRAQAVHHGTRFFPGSGRAPVEERSDARLRRMGPPSIPAFTGENTHAAVLSGMFRFIGRTETIGWLPEPWHAAEAGTLWNYNLHYFDWLWALEPDDARAVVRHWIACSRAPGFSSVAFDPYPTSLRLGNWSRYFATVGEPALDATFERQLAGALIAEMDWLERHLETRLLANHYFENAAALAIAGAMVDHPRAKEVRRTGIEILKRELPEQFPPDGLHFERSPMYHVRMTEVLTFLADLEDDEIRGVVDPVLARALDALRQVVHPDGEIALLNDSAFGVHRPGQDLVGEGSPEPGAFALPDAGYFGYRGANGDYVIADYGALGPNYNLGHAHGDVFSFELSIAGRRVITDTGVSTYDDGLRRTISRSTRAHNTVEIDGEDQAEFWSRHRVGRRPKVEVARWDPSPEGFAIEGWHDGYQSRRARADHSRTMEFDRTGSLRIIDRAAASKPCRVRSFLHFDPGISLRQDEDKRFMCLFHGKHVMRVEYFGDVTIAFRKSPYYPRFGASIDRACLAATGTGKEPLLETRLTWATS